MHIPNTNNVCIYNLGDNLSGQTAIQSDFYIFFPTFIIFCIFFGELKINEVDVMLNVPRNPIPGITSNDKKVAKY